LPNSNAVWHVSSSQSLTTAVALAALAISDAVLWYVLRR